MKPVDQTKFTSTDGNCFAACVASIMELGLDDVPDLAGPEQLDKLETWLKTRGLSYVEVTLRPRSGKDGDMLFERFGLNGTGYIIAGGKSPRGDWEHAIVVRVNNADNRVEFIHDPHPDRTWIRDIQTLTIIVPVHEAEGVRDGSTSTET